MPITAKQKSLLHVAKARLGLDDETYRQILHSNAGVRSAADNRLTLSGFRRVMDHLTEKGFKKTPGTADHTGYTQRLAKWKKAVGYRPDMATPEQLAKLETDWDFMKWYWAPDGFGNYTLSLRGFIRKCARVGDLRFMTFGQAHKTIEAMKSIKGRGQGPEGTVPEFSAEKPGTVPGETREKRHFLPNTQRKKHEKT
ncbi:MAG: regulatory protein GemA [Deltaproteobacteria bacterium]|nr:regulatory protein GemA [Deltaproteobacteria bacterium]